MLKLTHLAGFGGKRRRTRFELTIARRASNVDLYSYLSARGYRNEPEVAVAIGAGVQVYATSTAGAGLTVHLAAFPRKCRIVLTNRGEICGRGGASRAAGGKALQVRRGSGAVLAIDNRGEINGGVRRRRKRQYRLLPGPGHTSEVQLLHGRRHPLRRRRRRHRLWAERRNQRRVGPIPHLHRLRQLPGRERLGRRREGTGRRRQRRRGRRRRGGRQRIHPMDQNGSAQWRCYLT